MWGNQNKGVCSVNVPFLGGVSNLSFKDFLKRWGLNKPWKLNLQLFQSDVVTGDMNLQHPPKQRQQKNVSKTLGKTITTIAGGMLLASRIGCFPGILRILGVFSSSFSRNNSRYKGDITFVRLGNLYVYLLSQTTMK